MALRIAFLFEGYAIDCASQLSDHGMYTSSQGAAGRTMAQIPKPPGLPESGFYEYLNSETLNRIFSLPQNCAMAQDVASSLGEVADDDAYLAEIKESTVKLALEAASISRRLRSDHSLVDRRLEYGEWDVDKFLDRELENSKLRIVDSCHYHRPKNSSRFLIASAVTVPISFNNRRICSPVE